jgi:hypothetical protein
MEVFTDSLIVCSIFVLPKHLAIYVDRDVDEKPNPSHFWVFVSDKNYV